MVTLVSWLDYEIFSYHNRSFVLKIYQEIVQQTKSITNIQSVSLKLYFLHIHQKSKNFVMQNSCRNHRRPANFPSCSYVHFQRIITG